MPEHEANPYPVRRTVAGPVVVTGVLVVLAMVAALGSVVSGGWVLTWLLLGLTAGYALSGSV
jgi:hypothetical protein